MQQINVFYFEFYFAVTLTGKLFFRKRKNLQGSPDITGCQDFGKSKHETPPSQGI